MSRRSIGLDEDLHDYLLSVSLREPALLTRLREETDQDAMARMQIAPEQGQFMSLLVRLLGAQRAVEIGTYTGYSSLCIARALPAAGRLVCCDVSEEWTAIARRYWREAGLDDRIELQLAPAMDTLGRLLEGGEVGSFDFAFIDADKEQYQGYYEACLRLLRPGGLVAVDNTLWSGRVAQASPEDESTAVLQAFNARLRDDDRVDLSLVPIGDGLTLARKR